MVRGGGAGGAVAETIPTLLTGGTPSLSGYVEAIGNGAVTGGFGGLVHGAHGALRPSGAESSTIDEASPSVARESSADTAGEGLAEMDRVHDSARAREAAADAEVAPEKHSVASEPGWLDEVREARPAAVSARAAASDHALREQAQRFFAEYAGSRGVDVEVTDSVHPTMTARDPALDVLLLTRFPPEDPARARAAVESAYEALAPRDGFPTGEPDEPLGAVVGVADGSRRPAAPRESRFARRFLATFDSAGRDREQTLRIFDWLHRAATPGDVRSISDAVDALRRADPALADAFGLSPDSAAGLVAALSGDRPTGATARKEAPPSTKARLGTLRPWSTTDSTATPRTGATAVPDGVDEMLFRDGTGKVIAAVDQRSGLIRPATAAEPLGSSVVDLSPTQWTKTVRVGSRAQWGDMVRSGARESAGAGSSHVGHVQAGDDARPLPPVPGTAGDGGRGSGTIPPPPPTGDIPDHEHGEEPERVTIEHVVSPRAVNEFKWIFGAEAGADHLLPGNRPASVDVAAHARNVRAWWKSLNAADRAGMTRRFPSHTALIREAVAFQEHEQRLRASIEARPSTGNPAADRATHLVISQANELDALELLKQAWGETILVPASDGQRMLAVTVSGPADGIPVVLLHGTPGSRVGPKPTMAELDDAAAELHRAGGARGSRKPLRLISFDRPGFGASTPNPGLRVSDTGADVMAIADALFPDEGYYVVGRSGGASGALAAAALDPRVLGVAALGPLAPPDAVADFHGAMTAANRESVVDRLAKLRQRVAAFRADLNPEHIFGDLAPTDVPIAQRRLPDFMAAYLVAFGPEHSHEAWVADSEASEREWGIDLSAIDKPAMIITPLNDIHSPPVHAAALAARLRPDIRLLYGVQRTSHFGLVEVTSAVIAQLTQQTRSSDYLDPIPGNTHDALFGSLIFPHFLRRARRPGVRQIEIPESRPDG